MGILKSTSDVKSLKEAAKAAGSICDHLIQLAKPGVNTLHLETLAVEELKRVRSSAPFRQVDNFGFATCISLNEEVVNAPPKADKVIQEGDLVSIAIGTEIRGIHGKAARTVYVGNSPSPDIARLLQGTGQIFQELHQFPPESQLRPILERINQIAAENQLVVVDQTGGAGIGKRLHEVPNTPNNPEELEEDVKLNLGFAFTLMPMMGLGDSGAWTLAEDGWTYVLKSGQLAAHFADTLWVASEGIVNLSRMS